MIIIKLLIICLLMHIDIDLSNLDKITSPTFQSLYKNRARHLHLYGGAGSSKSHFAAQKWLARILAGFKTGHKHKIVALRKTQPAVRKSVYTLFENKIEEHNLQALGKCYPSDLTVRFVNGSQIICGGLDDPQKIKSIERITGFWLEEANEFTVDDMRQIDLRLRGNLSMYKQIMYTYNPVDIAHHLYQRIHKVVGDGFTGVFPGKENTYLHHSTYHDNPFIDDEYIQILEDLKEEDPGYYKIYTLGQWGALKNLIYLGWSLADSWPESFDDECYGLDFGFNHQTALVHVGTSDDIPYLTEKIYVRKHTNTMLIQAMDSLGINKDIPIYADSAEPARIEEISEAGYDIYPATEAKKPNAVKARIDFCKRSRFRVDPYSSNILKELSVYKYKETKDGIVLDEPVKFMDHAMNAFEYGYYEHFRMTKSTPGFAVIKA